MHEKQSNTQNNPLAEAGEGWLVGCSQNSLNVTMFYISKCKNFLSNVRYQPNVLVTVSQSKNWHMALWSFMGIDRFTPLKIKLNVVGFSISPLLCQAFFFLSVTICQLKFSLLEK